MFYQNAYPFTAVFYGLYPIRDPASRGQRQNHASDRALPYQKPLVFTPTHRLAKEMRARGVQAQTYHSFFQRVPRVIICDEVCTVPCPTLQTFLDWLERRGVQGICCGEQGQPPLIAGEMPHDWLCGHAAYYEEVEVDHRAKKKCGPGGVQAQTYHSFFRWSGQTDWTPERMGQKFVPRVIIWDEVCTVPCPTLQTFDWLEGRGVQDICCGNQGSRPQSPEKCHTTGSAGMPPITKVSR